MDKFVNFLLDNCGVLRYIVVMKKVIKIKQGDLIPDEARYLHSQKEPDKANSRIEFRHIQGLIYERTKMIEITPLILVHYYEVQA